MTRPKLQMVRPSAPAAGDTPARGPRGRAAARVDEGDARIVVQVSTSQHRALKARAATLGKTIREYVLELLERDGAFR